jgi:hypothetical protein
LNSFFLDLKALDTLFVTCFCPEIELSDSLQGAGYSTEIKTSVESPNLARARIASKKEAEITEEITVFIYLFLCLLFMNEN